MIERTYLSLWLSGYTEHNMLSNFGKALDQFPFSRLAPEALLRVFAIEFSEPALLEQRFGPGSDSEEVLAAATEFAHADCACQLECYWDVLQKQGEEWKLTPARVVITCFGPLFENPWGEQLQFEFGYDSPFVPAERGGTPLRAAKENVTGLLRLARLLEEALPVQKTAVWNDSGESLAEKFAESLE